MLATWNQLVISHSFVRLMFSLNKLVRLNMIICFCPHSTFSRSMFSTECWECIICSIPINPSIHYVSGDCLVAFLHCIKSLRHDLSWRCKALCKFLYSFCCPPLWGNSWTKLRKGKRCKRNSHCFSSVSVHTKQSLDRRLKQLASLMGSRSCLRTCTSSSGACRRSCCRRPWSSPRRPRNAWPEYSPAGSPAPEPPRTGRSWGTSLRTSAASTRASPPRRPLLPVPDQTHRPSQSTQREPSKRRQKSRTLATSWGLRKALPSVLSTERMEAKRRSKERRRTRLVAALILQQKKDIIVYLRLMLMILYVCVYI